MKLLLKWGRLLLYCNIQCSTADQHRANCNSVSFGSHPCTVRSQQAEKGVASETTAIVGCAMAAKLSCTACDENQLKLLS